MHDSLMGGYQWKWVWCIINMGLAWHRHDPPRGGCQWTKGVYYKCGHGLTYPCRIWVVYWKVWECGITNEYNVGVPQNLLLIWLDHCRFLLQCWYWSCDCRRRPSHLAHRKKEVRIWVLMQIATNWAMQWHVRKFMQYRIHKKINDWPTNMLCWHFKLSAPSGVFYKNCILCWIHVCFLFIHIYCIINIF